MGRVSSHTSSSVDQVTIQIKGLFSSVLGVWSWGEAGALAATDDLPQGPFSPTSLTISLGAGARSLPLSSSSQETSSSAGGPSLHHPASLEPSATSSSSAQLGRLRIWEHKIQEGSGWLRSTRAHSYHLLQQGKKTTWRKIDVNSRCHSLCLVNMLGGSWLQPQCDVGGNSRPELLSVASGNGACLGMVASLQWDSCDAYLSSPRKWGKGHGWRKGRHERLGVKKRERWKLSGGHRRREIANEKTQHLPIWDTC